MSQAPHLQQGEAAEAQACQYLEQQGLKLRQRNYRCRQGEIDLVMDHGQQLVFVEVRYRRSTRFGSGAESVNPRKQHKLVLAAQHFLQAHPKLNNKPARFDVVSMQLAGQTAKIDWIQDAFQAG